MNNVYKDGTYLKNNPTWHAEDASWKLGKLQQVLKRAKLTDAFKTVCDMGCGSGELIKLWAAEQPQMRFTGYDISRQAYELCLQHKPENVSFCCEENKPAGPFDLALGIDVMEHVVEDEAWLEEVTHLAPTIVLHVPLQLSLFAVLHPEFLANEFHLVGHVHAYTMPFLKRLLKRHNLEILAVSYDNKYMEKPTYTPKNVKQKIDWFVRKVMYKFFPSSLAAIIDGGYSAMIVCRRKN